MTVTFLGEEHVGTDADLDTDREGERRVGRCSPSLLRPATPAPAPVRMVPSASTRRMRWSGVVPTHPEISLIFAHGVGSLKELWDVPCPSPTGEPFGPRGGVVPTHSARDALRALLLDVVSIQ